MSCGRLRWVSPTGRRSKTSDEIAELKMILKCYLDDSRQQRRSAVAGYMGSLRAWELFEERWRALLDSAPCPISEFKASAVRARRGGFSLDHGWSEQSLNEFAIRTVETLSSSVGIYGVGVASLLDRVERPEDGALLDSLVLETCFRVALLSLTKLGGEYGAQMGGLERIDFVLDEQPGLMGRMTDAFEKARELVARDTDIPMKLEGFRDSKEVLPLQAADILAYETRKDLVNRTESPQRPRSRALIRLIESIPHVGFYLRPLSVIYDQGGDLGIPGILYSSNPPNRIFGRLIDVAPSLDPHPLLPPRGNFNIA